MSFLEEAWPLRNNSQQFARVLLNNMSQFTQLSSRRERVTRRVRSGEVVTTRSRAVQPLDRSRVEGLLKAWLREISDRYIDYQIVRYFMQSGQSPEIRAIIRRQENERSDFSFFAPAVDLSESVNQAYQEIRRNFPRGAVMFLQNELTRDKERIVYLNPQSYNEYFSHMLDWDNGHCFGLVNHVQRRIDTLQLGGGSAEPLYMQGAARWLTHNGRRGIYAHYYE